MTGGNVIPNQYYSNSLNKPNALNLSELSPFNNAESFPSTQNEPLQPIAGRQEDVLELVKNNLNLLNELHSRLFFVIKEIQTVIERKSRQP